MIKFSALTLTVMVIAEVIMTTTVRSQVAPVPLGSTIKGFVLPQRNAEGELQANITGVSAKAVSVNRTEITDLKIELYESGGKQIGTVITSPQCDLWNEENRLSTRSGVHVTRGDLQISAQAMEWELKEQRAVLRQQVRVVIDKFNFGATSPTSFKEGNTP